MTQKTLVDKPSKPLVIFRLAAEYGLQIQGKDRGGRGIQLCPDFDFVADIRQFTGAELAPAP